MTLCWESLTEVSVSLLVGPAIHHSRRQLPCCTCQKNYDLYTIYVGIFVFWTSLITYHDSIITTAHCGWVITVLSDIVSLIRQICEQKQGRRTDKPIQGIMELMV